MLAKSLPFDYLLEIKYHATKIESTMLAMLGAKIAGDKKNIASLKSALSVLTNSHIEKFLNSIEFMAKDYKTPCMDCGKDLNLDDLFMNHGSDYPVEEWICINCDTASDPT